MNPLALKLTHAFSAHHDLPALEVGDRVLTYAELGRAAWACANQLRQNSPPASRVGIVAQRSVPAYAAVLGSILSGRPYVPINPKFPDHRRAVIADAAKCAAYVSDTSTEDIALTLSCEFGGYAFTPDIHADAETSDSSDGGHAYVMFTSGTTGLPKGVAVTYDNVASYVDAFANIAEVRPTDRCSQLFDLSFDLSVHDMMVTWTAGACLCVPTYEELIDPVGFAVRKRLSCWFSVPSIVTMAKQMRRLAPGALPDLRLSLFCGEALPTSIAEAWANAAPNSDVWNLYGPTEATIAITAYQFEPGNAGAMGATVPLGDAYDRCEVAVVDAGGAPVGMGEEGELLLAGAQITDGYVNNPEEQRAKFIHLPLAGFQSADWYRSGDLVRRDGTLGLVYQGRLDDQVKVSGYRVELLEIEEVLREASENPEVAVVPWPISEGGSATGLVGFVVGEQRDAKDLLLRCRKALASYMVPKRIIFVDALPLNANGKVDRRALRKAHLEPRPSE